MNKDILDMHLKAALTAESQIKIVALTAICDAIINQY
jgi:hypothetical protein